MISRTKDWAQVLSRSSLAGIPGSWQYVLVANGYRWAVYRAYTGQPYGLGHVPCTGRYTWYIGLAWPLDVYDRPLPVYQQEIRYAQTN